MEVETTPSRDDYIVQTLGDLHPTIASARVLMVGAGGIGCELLKNLVLSGFKEIHVVDLDTIDLSNLNRQFLFRREHIGKSKAHVAKETALQFNPEANVISYHANIKEKRFDVEWFKSFTIVVNALDNIGEMDGREIGPGDSFCPFPGCLSWLRYATSSCFSNLCYFILSFVIFHGD